MIFFIMIFNAFISNLSIVHQLALFFRVLSSKFGDAYREFTSEDSSYRYICLLNQSDLDMLVLIILGSDGTVQVTQHFSLEVKT